MRNRACQSICGLLAGAFSILALAGLPAIAQGPGADRAAAIKEALAKNQAALRQYQWVETTEVSLKGEVKKREQKQCYYGADGQVQKTPIPDSAAAAPPAQEGGGRRGGRLKQKVVENKVDELKDYMERVAALVKDYVPPDPDKIKAAEAGGNVSVQPSASTLTLAIKNYHKPGDSIIIAFDTAAKKLTSYTASTYVDKPKNDDVKLAVAFGSLDDGTSYPQQVVLDATAKHVQVKVTNAGYRKSAR